MTDSSPPVSMPPPRIPLVVAVLLVGVVAAAALTRVHVHVEQMGTFMIQGDTGAYVSMAVNLPHGMGLYDPRDTSAFTAATAYDYHPTMAASRADLAPFYGGLDLGLTYIYWIAIQLFGSFVPPVLALCWLQIIVDSLTVVAVFALGRRLLGPWAGLLAAALYSGLWSAVLLSAAYPFYYYWTGAFAIWSLLIAARLLDDDLPSLPAPRRCAWAALYGAVLGMAAMTRSFFLPMGVLMGALIALRHRARWRVVVPLVGIALVVQGMVLAPGFWRNYEKYGRFNLRWKWHTAYIGLGARPNPLGIKWDDRDGFAAARAAGLADDDPAYVVKYDDVMRGIVLDLFHRYPGLFARNFALNLYDGFTGFDGALGLEWRLRYGAHTSVSWQPPGMLAGAIDTPQAFLALLLTLQLPLWYAFARARVDRWLYAAVLLSGGFLTGFVALLCPPFLEYNSPYDGSFVLCMGLVLAALAGLTGQGLRRVLEHVRVDDAGAARLLPYLLAWLLLPSLCDSRLRFVAHLGDVAVASAACLAAWALAADLAGVRPARVVLGLGAALSGAGILGLHLPALAGLAGPLGPSAALQMLIAALLIIGWRRRMLGPWLFAASSLAVTGFRPEAVLLPLVVAMLLFDLAAEAVAGSAGATALLGLAVYALSRGFTEVHLRNSVFVVPLAAWLAARGAGALRRHGVGVSVVLIIAMLVVKGLAPVGMLPPLLLAAALGRGRA